MSEADFLDIAVRNLPGGLILVDLKGHVRAINHTAETLLGLPEETSAQTDYRIRLQSHPKIVKVLAAACDTLTGSNRQEVVTQNTSGEPMVLGYGTLVLKNAQGDSVGVGMTFQDITQKIPLMDSHRFLDIALRNLPGGLIFVDLQGKVRGVNHMAQRILGLTEEIEPGTDCHKAFNIYPRLVKVLLSTCQSLNATNRQEAIIHKPNGEKATLGYGTLILRNPQGQPVGVGLTFQDITRFIPLPLQTEFLRLVDRFFTPFAVTMVVAAMALGFAEPKDLHTAWAILIAMVVFNESCVFVARRRTEWTLAIGYARQATNFLANIILVYLLGTFWGPMWLLFVLTPVATALHADWKKTLITGVVSAGALLGIYASRGLEGAVGWGQASLHAGFIVFISLFVNAVARHVMQIKSSGAVARPQPSSSLAAPTKSALPAESKLAA